MFKAASLSRVEEFLLGVLGVVGGRQVFGSLNNGGVFYESKEKHQAKQACLYLDCWKYGFSEGIKRIQGKTGLQMQVSVDNPDFAEIGEIDDICRRKVQNREKEDELHVVEIRTILDELIIYSNYLQSFILKNCT